jgi:hypothetical protein
MNLPPDDESEPAADPAVDDATLSGLFVPDAGRYEVADERGAGARLPPS